MLQAWCEDKQVGLVDISIFWPKVQKVPLINNCMLVVLVLVVLSLHSVTFFYVFFIILFKSWTCQQTSVSRFSKTDTVFTSWNRWSPDAFFIFQTRNKMLSVIRQDLVYNLPWNWGLDNLHKRRLPLWCSLNIFHRISQSSLSMTDHPSNNNNNNNNNKHDR